MILTEFMPLKPFAKPTSSPGPKLLTHSLSDPSWLKSIIHSSFPSNFRSNHLRSSTLSWLSSMVENYSITSNENSASTSTEPDSIRLSSFARSNAYMVSTWSTEISSPKTSYLTILDTLRCAISDFAKWT